MVPVRVQLTGFLSYRDTATLEFDGRNLWMLSGRNGVGKSSVFDAITFALFGWGRFGGRVVQDYINHHAPEMLVEFDFDLGPERYRVKRTVKRGGGSSYQAFGVDKATGAGVPIPGTNSDSGLKGWVEETVPLNRETFEAAALLKQGKADILLTPDAKTRRDFMEKIVNLRAYMNLHRKVKDRENAAKGDLDALRRILERLETDAKSTISKSVSVLSLEAAAYPVQETWHKSAVCLQTVLRDMETRAEADKAERDSALLRLAAITAQLENQAAKVGERANLLQQRAAFAAILREADAIRERARRFALLTAVLPQLSAWLEARKEYRNADAARVEAAASQETWTQALQEANEMLTGAKEQVDSARAAAQDAHTILTETKTRLDDLKNRRKLLDAADDGQGKCRSCGQELTAEHLETERDAIDTEIAEFQARYHTAQNDSIAATKAIKDAEAEASQRLQEARNAEGQISKADTQGKVAIVEQGNALQKAEAAYQSLATNAADFAALLYSAPQESIETVLRDRDTPTADEVRTWQEERKSLIGAETAAKELAQAQQQAAHLDGQIAAAENDIAAADAALTAQEENASIRAILAELTTLRATVKAQIESLEAGPFSTVTPKTIRETAAHVPKAAQTVQKRLTDEKQLAELRRQNAHDAVEVLTKTLAEYEIQRDEQGRVATKYNTLKTLAKKLDEDHLQRHLRDGAETAIVTNADVILQRLSQGALRVTRSGDRSEALKLDVFDHDKGDKAMRPPALSGSQQFRLAVALALGIGQYACGASAGGVESVIVDEGFGSLDKEGREKMIEELHRLGTLLKRVIIVSHQEEFEAAFPNQWQITLENGTACASLRA